MTQMTADDRFDLRNAQNIVSCGPFGGVSAEELLATLEDLGLCLDADGGLGEVVEGEEGLYLEASGPQVRGTLIAVEDGEQAEDHELRRLVLACARPGCEVRFTGTARVSARALQTVLSRATHDGRRCDLATTRTVVTVNGGTRRTTDTPAMI